MDKMYGVVNHEGVHYDTSLTERGAKNYARRNGYKKVSYRSGYNAVIIAELVKGKWKGLQDEN